MTTSTKSAIFKKALDGCFDTRERTEEINNNTASIMPVEKIRSITFLDLSPGT